MRFMACAVAVTAAAISAACARTPTLPALPSPIAALVLRAQYVVPRPAAPLPPQLRIGGLSGLANLPGGRELLAISDDHDYPRVFRVRASDGESPFRIHPSNIIYLEPSAAAPRQLDTEAIAITREGHLLVTSEGVANEEPRLPPAILEYSSDGQFVRQLTVRRRYFPDERGPLTVGVRENAGFESLAMTPDYSRFFTATELPLTQDGEADPFAPGGRSRLLEYVAAGGSYEPRREFVYELEPIERPAFDIRFAITGIVELLSLGGDEMLALERGFVESTDRRESRNWIRIFRIDVGNATDISSRDSLRGVTGIIPVRKTLIVDVNRLAGLTPPLTLLDNFEGMAWGPPVAGAGRSLVLVSDDNFSERQMTAFLVLGRRN